MRIIFAGDTASPRNIYPDRAFEGSKCWPRLESWITKLGLVPDECLLYNTDTSLNFIRALQCLGYKVVACGGTSSQRLTKAGVPHHKIDHPSFRNRKLNHKEYVDKMLLSCYNYIWRT
jgi:hypothetical protein